MYIPDENESPEFKTPTVRMISLMKEKHAGTSFKNKFPMFTSWIQYLLLT